MAMNIPVNVPQGYSPIMAFSQPAKTGISETAPETSSSFGEFTKGLPRGYYNAKSALWGAVGLSNDLVGDKAAAEYALSNAAENAREAAKYPAKIRQATDIRGFGDAADYVLGLVGDQATNLALGMGTGSLGVKLVRSLGENAVKGLIREEIAKRVAAGALEEVAMKQVANELLTTAGARAGAAGLGITMESGSNWLDDATIRGIGNTSPLRDLVGGVAGGSLEAFGIESQLLSGKLRGIGAADAALKGILGEGVIQEGGQYVASNVATRQPLTIEGLFNAAVPGAIIGGGPGAIAGIVSKSPHVDPNSKVDPVSTSVDLTTQTLPDPSKSPDVKMVEKAATTQVMADQHKTSEAKLDYSIGQLETRQRELASSLKLLNQNRQNQVAKIVADSNNQVSISDANAMVDSQFKPYELELAKVSAQIAKTKAERSQLAKDNAATLSSLNKNFDKQIVKAQVEQNLDGVRESLMRENLGDENTKVKDQMFQRQVGSFVQNELDYISTKINTNTRISEDLNAKLNDMRNSGEVILDPTRMSTIANELANTQDQIKKDIKLMSDIRQQAAHVVDLYHRAPHMYQNENWLFQNELDKLYSYGIRKIDTKRIATETKLIQDAVASVQRDDVAQKESKQGALKAKRQEREQSKLERRIRAEETWGLKRAQEQAAFTAGMQKLDETNRSNALNDYVNGLPPNFNWNMTPSEAGINQRMQDARIAREIEAGTLPGVLPYEPQTVPHRPSLTPVMGSKDNLSQPIIPVEMPGSYSETESKQERLRKAPGPGKPTTPSVPGYVVPAKEQKPSTPRYLIPAKTQREVSWEQNAEKRAAQARQSALMKSEQVKSWIKNSIDKLPGLSRYVNIAADINDLPENLREGLSNQMARIDLATGKIYLMAWNIPNKTLAVKKLLHEGVAHHGLRRIMTEAQFNELMNTVIRGFGITKKWADIKKLYPEYNEFELAEEFIARESEKIRLNEDTMTKAQSAFNKVKAWIRNLLRKLGLVNATKEDVDNVLLASIHYLSKGVDGKWGKNWENAGDFRFIRDSREYKTWLNKAGGLYTTADGMVRDWMNPVTTNDSGEKILRKRNLRDIASEALADTLYSWKSFNKLAKERGAKIDAHSNVYETEKPISNRIAVRMNAFLKEVIGFDPQEILPKISNDSILGVASQLINKDTITKDNLIEILGDVLHAKHSSEVNERISKMSGGKIEDGSALSNEDAKKILDKFVTPENALIWERIFSDIKTKITEPGIEELLKKKIISKEEAARWRNAYSFYVPLKGWEHQMESMDPTYTAFAARRGYNMATVKGSYERKGRSTMPVNPFVALIHQMEDRIRASENIEVGRAALRFAEENQDTMGDMIKVENLRDIRELTSKIKDKILESRDMTMAQEIKQLYKQMQSNWAEIKDIKNKVNKLKATSYGKAGKVASNITAKIDQYEKRILELQDINEAIKQQREGMKNALGADAVFNEIQDLKKQRRDLLLQRGYKIVEKDGKLKKAVKGSQFEGKSNNVITVIDEDGTKVKLWFGDENMVRALKGQNVGAMNSALRFMSRANSYIAKMYTTLSPGFLLTNPIRDFVTALINIREVAQGITSYKLDPDKLTNNMRKDYMPALKGTFEAIRSGDYSGEWGTWIKHFQSTGAMTTMVNLNDYADSYKRMSNAVARTMDTSIGGKAVNTMAAGLNFMEDLSTSLENVTRLIAFKNLAQEFMSQGMPEGDAYNRAGNIALDLTVNFSKRGTHSGFLSALFIFANANIQANYRLLRSMFPAYDKSKPWYKRRIFRYSAGLAMAGYTMAALARAMGGDDDDGISYYDKIPSWVKEMNLVIMDPVNKGEYIKIPLPYGFHIFFMVGSLLDQVQHNQITVPQAVWRLTNATYSNFTPMGDAEEGTTVFVPTLFRPLVQIELNRNFFGRPIRPESQPWTKGEYPDSQKYWETTPKVYVKMAEWLNSITGGSKDRSGAIDMSPTTFEHIVTQFSGGIGRSITSIFGVFDKLASGQIKDIGMEHLPLTERFVGKVSYYNTLSTYNKIKTEIYTQLNEYKRAKSEGMSTSDLMDVSRKTQAGRLLEKKLQSVQQKLNKLTEKEHKIQRSRLSDEALLEFRNSLRTDKERVIADFIRQAKKAGIN